jgi:hypothetical protein
MKPFNIAYQREISTIDPEFEPLSDDFRTIFYTLRLIIQNWDSQFNITNVNFAKSPYYTVTDVEDRLADYLIRVDCTAGNCIINAPTLAQLVPGHRLRIKKVDTTANSVTVNGVAGNIDAAATYVFNTPWEIIEIQWNGTTWDIISNAF